MSEKDKKPAEKPGKTVNVGAFVLGLIIVALVIAGTVMLIGHYQRQAAGRKAVIERQQLNDSLGLPRDYPSDVVPIFEGVTIVGTERGSAISTQGEPMDKWVVNAEIDAEKEPVKEFYSDLLIESGFSQQYYIGLPTGYGMKYADEECTVELTIEFRPPGELLKIDIVIHRLRG